MTTTTSPLSDRSRHSVASSPPSLRSGPVGDRGGGSLVARLQTEWDHLATRRTAVCRARNWSVTAVHFDDLDELLTLTGYRSFASYHASRGSAGRSLSSSAEECNEVTGRLLAVAATDDLAARILLQRMLPGLVALARRAGHRPGSGRGDERGNERGTGRTGSESGDQVGVIDDLLAAAWTAIRGWNPTRSSRVYVAALLSDAWYVAVRRPLRRRRLAEGSFDPQWIDERLAAPSARPAPFSELIELLGAAQAAGVLDAHELAAIAASINPADPGAPDGSRQVGARMMRYRRAAAIAKVRRFALDAA